MDDKIKEVMALVLNACDASEYQKFNKAYALRKTIETKLAELVQIPPGYALVPVEPTEEMIDAAMEAYMPFGDMELALSSAMLAAAQKEIK